MVIIIVETKVVHSEFILYLSSFRFTLLSHVATAARYDCYPLLGLV